MPASDAIVDPASNAAFAKRSASRTCRSHHASASYSTANWPAAIRADEPSNQLARLFDYQGIDTCAATGLCADRCPVGINTGSLIKKLRHESTVLRAHRPLER